jgi:hypothetical protein
MWENRLIWTAAAPPWWPDAWGNAIAALRRQRREAEDRPDTYLVLPDRADVGLKLRGQDGQLEVKVRHESTAGWELWEKIPFFEWNALEGARLAAILQRDLPQEGIDPDAEPVAGVKALLRAAAMPWREIEVGKQRMQARTGDLLPGLAASLDPAWLAEIVEIDVGGRTSRSICFETMSPDGNVADALPDGTAGRNTGYPAFLIGQTG